MKIIIRIIFVSLFIVSCNNKQDQKDLYDLVITNANIIDLKNDQLLQNHFIAIYDDTIRKTGAMEDLPEYKTSNTIDANNKYVMPGLWDMHVHFRGGDSLIDENKELLKLFLAYGVTTVRDAGGDITPAVLEWRKNIQENSLDGPNIFSPGPKLDGEDPAWEGSLPITNTEDIKAALDSLEEINVDFVKIYDGSLTANNFYNILQAAEKRGLKTTSHVPLSASLMTAVDYGLDGVEHMYYIAKAGSPLADSLAETDLGYGMMSYVFESFDENLARKVYQKLAIEEVSVTPTLHIGKVLSNVLEDDHSQDSLRNYVGKGIQKTYQGRIESAKRAKAAGSTMRKNMEEIAASMIVPMYENGVNILAGSDSGAFNSFVYPGESLHAELQELVNSGLTPAQALQTSVINGPKFFGIEQFYGSLEKGKVADIIILDKNPLSNIKNTRSIKTIIKNMKSYKPDELLKKIESNKL